MLHAPQPMQVHVGISSVIVARHAFEEEPRYSWRSSDSSLMLFTSVEK